MPQHSDEQTDKTNTMNRSFVIVFLVFSFFTGLASCTKDPTLPGTPGAGDNHSDTTLHPTGSQMKIKIGANTFIATLDDHATATAFKALLPITVTMNELNGNEKYVDLAGNLPANATNPGTIQNGDLMLYGSNTLVLFYKTFSTSYRYTRIGRINDTTGLAAALGSGNLSVTYELE
jgi:hypothetical protein